MNKKAFVINSFMQIVITITIIAVLITIIMIGVGRIPGILKIIGF